MDSKNVCKDVAKVAYHGAMSVAFCKIGSDCINYGMDQVFHEDNGLGDKVLGVAIAACGVANLSTSGYHIKKTIDGTKELIVGIASLDDPDIIECEEEDIDIEINRR